MDTVLKKIRRTGTIDQQPGSGRPRSVCVNENIDDVKDLVLSQKDNQKRTDRIVRSHVKQSFTDCLLSVHKIIYHDLQLNCVKRRCAQQLCETNRVARLTLCKQLLYEVQFNFIWFGDERVYRRTTIQLVSRSGLCTS